MNTNIDMDTLFTKGQEAGASDVHLAVGKPPLQRIDGVLVPIEGYEPLTHEEVHALIDSVLTPKVSGEVSVLRERFDRERELDLSYQIPSGARLRVNCHYERDHEGLVARLIPDTVPMMDEVNLPPIVKELITADRGIILVTGPTGSGKSTSLAAMIESINAERPVHIVTLEDPIEFLYQPKKALIRQRQYGTDFLSFKEALRRILRQDPDVILVGEMRDLETIAAALTLAETGHLVFATLHTNSAAQTIERIIDAFPPHQQEQVRTQLSMTLKAVIAQRLVAKKGGGRVAVREVLLNTAATANIIRDNRIAELSNVIQTGAEKGMLTLARDAARLVADGILDSEAAGQFVSPEELKRLKPKKGFFG